MKLFALVVALGTATPALAKDATPTEAAAILAPMDAFVAAVNKGDDAALAATHTPDAVILDDFGQHRWDAPGALGHWLHALRGAMAKGGATKITVELAKPTVVDVEGNSAYAAIPATLHFVLNGKPATLEGGFATTFRQTGARWRISGWAWMTTRRLHPGA